jgi:hypothetical protein
MFTLLSCVRSEEECAEILRIARWGEDYHNFKCPLDVILQKRSRWMGITGRRRVYQKYFLSFMHERDGSTIRQENLISLFQNAAQHMVPRHLSLLLRHLDRLFNQRIVQRISDSVREMMLSFI